MQSKLCTKCKQLKSINMFAIRNKLKGLYHSSCKECKHAKSTCKCGAIILATSKACRKCSIILVHTKNKSLTINDKLCDLAPSRYGYVRYQAREVGKKLGFKSCINCGYSKHIEVCHIKAILLYDKNTLISEINKPENLIPLCRNCHWEFDNNLITLPQDELNVRNT